MPAPDPSGLPPSLRSGHPLLGVGYAEPVRERAFVRLDAGAASDGAAPVAEEVPVALVYNGRPHAVMMTTPADLEDFAVGFTLTEGIVAGAGDITGLAVSRHAQGIEVTVTIPDAAAEQLVERGRALIGRAGCGLCGVETIQQALRELPPVPSGPAIAIESLWRAERELPKYQTWNRQTGALHAAAWTGADGMPQVVREDVGRHNALDKVIGALAREGRPFDDGFMVITSRASYELVQKCVAVGIRLLAAVSRPTGLAIGLAEASGLTLVALLRGTSANVYANGERLG
ncbi:MAG TPA: formate dehydrogenase accessory sulfurtransferase FdhD [Gemmatimonadales bacterium]|nr:formate dehydrogenase accessory sulfurtransferase FdhD [Gemmatimonadales bacterium]